MTEPTLLDLTSEQDPRLFPRKRNSKGQLVNTSKTVFLAGKEHTVSRDARSVIGLTVHQTACIFGPADAEKKHRRALKIPAHVTAFRDGTYVQAAPLPWFLYHGNSTNELALGLECEGHYSGVADDPSTPEREDEESTWGGDPTPPDPLALATFRAAGAHLVTQGRKLGMPIEYVWAHRQSSESRRSDPGYWIWGEVVEAYLVPTFGLKVEYARTWKDGRPIPHEWARGATAKY